MMEYESSANIEYLSNIYTDGEKYYWMLYNNNSHRYYFDDLGYSFEDEAQRSLKHKVKELTDEV
jgi:hypothetical protein